MYYNISYDIISLVVLLIIAFHFFGQKEYPVFSNRLYGSLLIIGILNQVLDISGSLLIEESLHAPMWLANLVNALYYLVSVVFPAALAFYLLAMIENRIVVERKLYTLLLIPAALTVIAFLIGFPLGLVFRIEADYTYVRGPISYINYVALAVYLMVIMGILIEKGEVLSRRERQAFVILLALVVLATLGQILFPRQLLTGSAVAVSFLIMYFTVQNPQLMQDSETGVFNAHAFNQLITPAFTKRNSFQAAAFKVHDLHNIYMLYGHQAGDLVLRRIGKYLLRYEKAWSFRVADSTFLMTFRTEEELEKFAKDFEENRSKLVYFNSVEFAPKLTLVCLRHAEKLVEGEEILKVVNTALEDRDVIAVKNRTLNLDAKDIEGYHKRNVIENLIRRDLKDGENFVVYYQPIYSRKLGKFVSAEALVRYRNDELGTLPPGEFIPMIEDKGLAPELDVLVMQKVFADVKSGLFKEVGFDAIHVNLSAASFSSENIIRRAISLADEYEVDHRFIIFEITETTTVLSDEVLRSCAEMLRQNGFGFALDDFGTGYASMERLTDLPFTHAKLDRKIVRDSGNIIGEIVRIFRKFDMDIVAEGIETSDQVVRLESDGIDLIQGYYYARPMPREELPAFIKAKRNKAEGD